MSLDPPRVRFGRAAQIVIKVFEKYFFALNSRVQRSDFATACMSSTIARIPDVCKAVILYLLCSFKIVE